MTSINMGGNYLFQQLVSLDNLNTAWQRVRDNKGCAGVDCIAIPDFQELLPVNLMLLQKQIEHGIYRPFPLLRILVDKGNGEARALSIPTVRDRIAQAAALNILDPLFEAEFDNCSYAYRKNRSYKQAVLKVKEYYEAGFRWVLDADVDAFFDNVPHERLMEKVKKIVPEAAVQQLIFKWIKAEIWDGTAVTCSQKGIPQGSVISPILANLYLDELDDELLERSIRIVRYADDFVVLCKSKEKAQEAAELTNEILDRMSLHLDEADIVHFDQGFRFLGVVFCCSTLMVPFDKEKKERKIIYVPPRLNLS